MMMMMTGNIEVMMTGNWILVVSPWWWWWWRVILRVMVTGNWILGVSPWWWWWSMMMMLVMMTNALCVSFLLWLIHFSGYTMVGVRWNGDEDDDELFIPMGSCLLWFADFAGYAMMSDAMFLCFFLIAIYFVDVDFVDVEIFLFDFVDVDNKCTVSRLPLGLHSARMT